MMKICKIAGILTLLALMTAGMLWAGDWPQFRGPGGSSVSAEKDLPVKWSGEEGLRWKAPLPGRGLSNPVIAGGKVFVTACSGYRERRLHVLCFDAETGKKLWERQFHATGNTACHEKTCMAAPTPVTDGRSVYALFATADVAALDADGNLLWYRSLTRDYPAIANQVGMAASPTLSGDTLLIPMETDGASFVAGLDRKTGENKWKIDRHRGINWVSPAVTTSGGRPAALFVSPSDVTALDPGTGEPRWTFPLTGGSNIPSPAAGDGMVFAPGEQLTALKPGNDNETPEVLWRSTKYKTGYTSPVYFDKKLYVLTNTNVTCVNALSGEEIWRERVEGPFAATPVVADGKIYAVSEKGTTSILQLGDKPKLLAVNKIPDTILATPAISGGAIYLRSDGYLYCIGAKK
jgi:outer membrane protein assembly factor BamB